MNPSTFGDLIGSVPFARLGWTILHSLWIGALVSASAALLLKIVKSATTRHNIGFAALLLIALLTLTVSTFTPSTPQPANFSPLPTAPTFLYPAPLPHASPGPQQTLTRSSANFLQLSTPLLGCAYIIGLSVFSLLHLSTLIRITLLKRRCSPITDKNIGNRISHLSKALGLRFAPKIAQVLSSQWITAPVVAGFFRPIILIPSSTLTGLSPAQLDAILAHELAHLRRLDPLLNLVQSLIETLFFYHPAVWWLSSAIRTEREYCCDDLAARTCGSPLVYAQALTRLEELRLQSFPSLLLAATGRPSSLLSRIRRLINGTAPIPFPRTFPSAVTVALTTIVLLAFTGLLFAQTPAAITKTPATAPHAPLPSSRPSRLNPALDRTFDDFHLDNVPLSDAVENFRTTANVNIVVRWQSLAADLILPTTPVQIKLRNVTLAQALDALAASMDNIGWWEEGGLIVIGHQSPVYYVGGQVERAGVYSLNRRVTLLQALVAAAADFQDPTLSVRVIHRSGKAEWIEGEITLPEIANGPARDITLTSGDTVLVVHRNASPVAPPNPTELPKSDAPTPAASAPAR